MEISWKEACQIAGEIIETIEREEGITLSKIGDVEAVEAVAEIIYDKDRMEWSDKHQDWI